MNKLRLLLGSLVIACLLLYTAPTKAAACLTTVNPALKLCYDECNKLYSGDLAQACRFGCYIGCVFSEAV